MAKDYLFVVEPEEIFCASTIKFFNQPVGIILAETFELASRAAELVRVAYSYEGEFKVVLIIIID